jgi:hypothetical protein
MKDAQTTAILPFERQLLNGTVTYKPHRLPRHQRAQAHNSTPNSHQKIFM